MESDAAVGKRVEKLRVDARLSQGELSERLRAAGLNWSQGTLSRVETGSRPMRFVEALIVAGVLRVDATDLTPFGGGLTYAYHRRVQILEESRWNLAGARDTLHTDAITAQLFKFAVELSQGSKSPYVLHILPEQLVGHIGYQIGAMSDQDVLLMIGADAALVESGMQQLAIDLENGIDTPPSYAPHDFALEMDAYGNPEPGTEEFAEKRQTQDYLLERGMVGAIFRDAFPQVSYDYIDPLPIVIVDWPEPVVDGIDMSDLEQPLRRPAHVLGQRRGG